jgi:hypothetical protein
MAKRKERALARKGTVSKRGKARTKVNPAPRKAAKSASAKTKTKKAAKRAAVKTKAKKQATKAPAKRAAPKKVGSRPTEPSTKAAEETVIVDIVEEAVPGVVVVTEFESVRTSGPPGPPSRA